VRPFRIADCGLRSWPILTLVLALALSIVAAPLAARAQQVGKVYRIGILETIPAARNAANLDALRKGLRDLGYVEGRNLVIEYRSADGRAERFPNLASELVRLKMGNPAAPPEWEETETAARSLGLQARLLDVRSQDDLGRAFERAVRQHVDGLLIGADGLTQMHQQTIVGLVARNRLPAAYPARDFVEAGGLMAYALSYPDLYFRFASFIDKIFKGAKPADLPIEQPTKFELVINLKTAKSLGLTIPQSLLIRADEVIQ
jgi:ABC-type uncharacterized transport system substrate-binding protein